MIGYKNFVIDHHYIYKLFIYAVILIFEDKEQISFKSEMRKNIYSKTHLYGNKSTEMIESNL